MLIDNKEDENQGTNRENLNNVASPSSTESSQTTQFVQLTKEQIFQFVSDYYARNIAQLSFSDSCNQTYQYLLNTPSIHSTFALTRLALDKRFTPQKQNRQNFLEQILKNLQNIIDFQSRPNTREQHYAKIFRGKVLIQLGKMTEAYDQFMNLKQINKKFTQTYLVDIAEMIIEHGFVPQGMTFENAINHARDILESLPQRGHNRNISRQTRNMDVFGSLHLNTTGMRNQVNNLIQESTTVNHRPIQTSRINASQRRRNREQTNRTPYPQNRNNSEDIIHPLYIPQKPTRERIRGMSDQQREARVSGNSRIRGMSDQQHEARVSDNSGERTRKRQRQDFESSHSESENDLFPPRKIRTRDESGNSEATSDDSQETWLDHPGSSDNDRNECRKLILLGKIYGYQRNNSQSIACYQGALDILGDNSNPELRAQAYIGLGNARSGGDNYREALDILGDNGNPELRAQAYIGLGNARAGEGNYREALNILGDNGNPEPKAQTYIGLGNARDGTQQERIENYRKALNVLGDSGNPELRAQAYIGLGNARAGGDKGITHYNNALNILGDNGNQELRAQAYIGLGNARAGRENYRKALNILGDNGNQELKAQAYIGLGNARAGGENYRKALNILGDNSNPELRAHAYIGLGNARAGGDKGITHYNNALNILGDNGNQELRAQAYIGLGNTRAGRDKGITHYNNALNILGDNGNPELRAQAYIGLGNARAGGENYREALDILGDNGNPELRAQTYIGLGNSFANQKQTKKAIENFEEALRIAQKYNLKNQISKINQRIDRTKRFLKY